MYNVLFICSGNKSEGPGPVVSNQAQSLVIAGLEVDFFLIKGSGIQGYLKNLHRLKKQIRKFPYDIIHAHGVSSLLASFNSNKQLVVSLLGSELNENSILKITIRLLSKFFWKQVIVKSEDMLTKLALGGSDHVSIIPNGVNLKDFIPASKIESRKIAKWQTPDKPVVLFLANPDRISKNYSLLEKAIQILDNKKIVVKTEFGLAKEEVCHYINASDIMVLTSLWEGSPNVVKEAMACNRPIVSTDVGDVRWLFGNVPGHFITNFDPEDVAEKLSLAIEFSQKHGTTNGRARIIELGLDSETIAEKIISIYRKVLQNE